MVASVLSCKVIVAVENGREKQNGYNDAVTSENTLKTKERKEKKRKFD